MKPPLLAKMIGDDLCSAWIMATVGVCLGFVINQFRDNPLPLVYAAKAERIQQVVAKLTENASETTSPSSGDAEAAPVVHYLDFAGFRRFVEGKGIVLDARPKIYYRDGHVPGAISFPREDFEAVYGQQHGILEKDKSQPLAIYCSNAGCEDSQMVADALIKLAFKRVYVFKGGWSDWTGARLPEEKTQ